MLSVVSVLVSRPVSVFGLQSSPVTSHDEFSTVTFFVTSLCFRIFWYFRAMHCSLAVWQPVTSDNDFGVVYDSDYNDYSVVLPDK